jgi:hypothetical protein
MGIAIPRFMDRKCSALAACLFVASQGCYDPADTARVRAANEFDCAPVDVSVETRPELSEYTVDVSACGHPARYTCPPAGRGHGPYCTREPLE